MYSGYKLLRFTEKTDWSLVQQVILADKFKDLMPVKKLADQEFSNISIALQMTPKKLK
jgi:hypothetical protein